MLGAGCILNIRPDPGLRTPAAAAAASPPSCQEPLSPNSAAQQDASLLQLKQRLEAVAAELAALHTQLVSMHCLFLSVGAARMRRTLHVTVAAIEALHYLWAI